MHVINIINKIPVPILKCDPIYIIYAAENNIENCKLMIFKNCAHNVHLEQPDQFNKTVKDFLS